MPPSRPCELITMTRNAPVPFAQKNDDYYWATTHHLNKHLQTFLDHVPDGIKSSMLKYKIASKLDPIDGDWLTSRNGQYMKFVSPETDHFKQVERSFDTNKSQNNQSLLRRAAKLGMSPAQLHSTTYAQFHSLEVKVKVSKSPRCPTRAPNYVNNCETFLSQLWNFMAIIGDYDSMIALLSNPPKDSTCPSVNVNTLLSFVRHKTLQQMSPLTTAENEEVPVKDIFGRQILCEGRTQNVNWLTTLYAVMTHIHQSIEQSSSYIAQCKLCLDHFTSNGPPCPHHHEAHRRYMPTGNTGTCKAVSELKNWLTRLSKKRNYRPHKRSAFFPSDMRNIHTYISSQHFPLRHLVCYTMTLNAIECAMRWTGMYNTLISNFEDCSRHWLIIDGRVHHMAQAVREKNDHAWATYRHSFHDDHPKLCFLRHLLVLVHCHCKLGENVIYHVNENEPVQISDCDYKSWINQIVAFCLVNVILFMFSPHTPRITSYFWGVLGGGQFDELKRNARHRHDATANTYYQDSAAIKAAIDADPLLGKDNSIWAFSEKLVQGTGTSFERLLLSHPHRNVVTSLHEAAALFVQNNIGVASTHPRYKDAEYLLNRSYERPMFQEVRPVALNRSHERPMIQEDRPDARIFVSFLHQLPEVETRTALLQQFNHHILPILVHHGAFATASPTMIVNNIHTPGSTVLPDPDVHLGRNPSTNLVYLSFPGDDVGSVKFSSRKFTNHYKLCVTTGERVLLAARLLDEIKSVDPTVGHTMLDSVGHLRSTRLRGARTHFTEWITRFSTCFVHCCQSDVAKWAGIHGDSGPKEVPPYNNNKAWSCRTCSTAPVRQRKQHSV